MERFTEQSLASLRQVLLAAGGLVVCLIGFDVTAADLSLAELLYDGERHRWLWSGSEPIGRLVFYDGPKLLLIVSLLALLAGLLLTRYRPRMARHARGIRIVVMSLILVPASVAGLKDMTNVACPNALTGFGGQIAYVGTLHHYPQHTKPVTRQHCFPAAHASGGFALLALFFLFDTPRKRRRALALGLGAGWIMGAYKMAIGDHFLSHTVVSMLWSWLLINLIVLADGRIFGASRARAGTAVNGAGESTAVTG